MWASRDRFVASTAVVCVLLAGALRLDAAHASALPAAADTTVRDVRALRAQGNAADAADLLESAALASEAAGERERALALWTEAATTAHAARLRGAVARALAHATRAWEDGRDVVPGAEAIEVRRAQAAALAPLAILEAMDRGGSDPVAEAFARAEPFVTRTVLERMAGPAAFGAGRSARFDPPIPTLAGFRRDVLRPDEVFFEFVSGADTTFLFALTRDEARIVGVPGSEALAGWMARVRAACAVERRARADAAPDSVAFASLGRALFGAVTDLTETRPAILVAADGALRSIPFGALVAPGARGPLAAHARVTSTPSAAFLAMLRARTDPHRSGLRIVSGGTPGALGGEGAPEARWLLAHLDDVAPWSEADAAPGRPDGIEALHVAAPTRVDDAEPWRTPLPGSSQAPAHEERTASESSRARRVARLVVLSRCVSEDRASPGRGGVMDVAAAALAAGARAVVVPLWPIDDRATARILERFYARLARGETVARALREAQASVRAGQATRAPYFWAGFVVVGDDVALHLTRHVTWQESLAGIAACLLALVMFALLVLAWQRRRG